MCSEVYQECDYMLEIASEFKADGIILIEVAYSFAVQCDMNVGFSISSALPCFSISPGYLLAMVALLKRVLAALLFQATRSLTESHCRDYVPMLA
jgi:hypothetical protein